MRFSERMDSNIWFGDYSSILVPRTARNLASHAGWAGQAGAVTRLPAAMASVIARLTYVPPACVTSGPTTTLAPDFLLHRMAAAASGVCAGHRAGVSVYML